MQLSLQEQAGFETSKRLLAQIVNEGLLRASLSQVNGGKTQWLKIERAQDTLTATGIKSVEVATCLDEPPQTTSNRKILSILRPEVLRPPIILHRSEEDTSVQYDPGALFDLLSEWFEEKLGNDLRRELIAELRNSAVNQVWWLENSKKVSLDINSASIAWEHTLLWGHPTHPWHRTCFSIPPLEPVTPDHLASMVDPILSFVSVPREALHISGQFESVLQPLLDKLEIPRSTDDRVIVPCLQQQLPFILMRFPETVVLASRKCAQAQANMRTVTVSPELSFPYHLKLPLACKITSVVRIIHPWEACGGSSVSQMLGKLLPPNLWIFDEVAAVCGSQNDFDEAEHLACVLRCDLESRADAAGERLIMAAALAQASVEDRRCWAERLFKLDSIQQRKDWLRSYVQCLFQLVLPPLANYGICLEAHGQNMVARFCRATGTLQGFAVRDCGGLRLHMPTLHRHGYTLDKIQAGSAIKTDDLGEVWKKSHHSLVQMHVGHLIAALRLEDHGAWTIVREQLCYTMASDEIKNGRDLCEFFMRDTMPFKCFIKMKIDGEFRDNLKRDVPNVLLQT